MTDSSQGAMELPSTYAFVSVDQDRWIRELKQNVREQCAYKEKDIIHTELILRHLPYWT